MAVALAGCAGPRNPVKNQVPLKDIVWLEPAADEGVVYMLRAPHDEAVIVPVVDGARVARLPAESYVAVKLPAGTHRLTAVKEDAAASRASTLTFELKGGERRFFYLSTALPNPERMSGPAGAAVAGTLGLVGQVAVTAFVGALHQEPEGYGTYAWTECTDLDARGLASFSKEVTAR